MQLLTALSLPLLLSASLSSHCEFLAAAGKVLAYFSAAATVFFVHLTCFDTLHARLVAALANGEACRTGRTFRTKMFGSPLEFDIVLRAKNANDNLVSTLVGPIPTTVAFGKPPQKGCPGQRLPTLFKGKTEGP